MGYLTRMAKMRHAYGTLVGKPEAKRQLGRSRCRWEIILEWILAK